MKRLKKWCLTLTVALTALTANAGELQKPTEIPRVLISTDIGGTDPDDNQSIAHLMMYTDLFDLEGLVSSPSFGSNCAGARYQLIVREEIMRDWAQRWQWLKDEDEEAYIFTSFREPSTDGMRYLYSYDALHWDTIPGVIMAPMIGNEKPYTDAFTGEEKWPNFAPQQRCLRDPSIIQGPDGTFHLVWTTQWSGSRFFGYASSKDQLFYDEDLKLYFIIWSSQIDPKTYTDADKLGTNNCHRLWYTTTKDFQTFTPAKRYYDPGFNSIDGFLIKRAPKDYVLVVKDNRKPGFSNLFCVFGESPYGPFKNPTERIGRTFSEGPCAVQLPDGEWLIYFDQYHPQEYTAVSTRDFKTFTSAASRVSIPETHKHGTIVKIKKSLLDKILNAGNTLNDK